MARLAPEIMIAIIMQARPERDPHLPTIHGTCRNTGARVSQKCDASVACHAIASCTRIPHVRCGRQSGTGTSTRTRIRSWAQPEARTPRPRPSARVANLQLPSGIRNMPHGRRREWARARRNPLRPRAFRQQGKATTTTTVSKHASVAAAAAGLG